VVNVFSPQTSFKTLQNWVQELQSLGPENIVIAIAGNKCDLDDKREVERETAKTYAEEIDAIFVETSAKTGDNVQEMFTDISKRLPATSQQANPNVIIHSDAGQKKKCC
jgi:GTPase SAR1 family protein